jgi:LysM repeat protein
MRNLIFTTLFVFLAALVFAGPNGKYIYHTVEKGETLYSISHQYGLKPAEVAQYNEMSADKPTIRVGQKIKIPSTEMSEDVSAEASSPAAPAPVKTAAAASAAPASSSATQYHIVKKGETVFSISKLYNVSRADLLSWNKINDNNIAVGQKLLIKGDGNAANAPAAKPAAAPAKTNSTEPGLSKSDIERASKNGYAWTLPDAKKTNVSTASSDVTASATSVGLADTRTIKSWKAESTSETRDYFKGKNNVYDPSTEYESLYYQNIYSGMTKKTETGVAKFTEDNNTANTAYYNNAPIGTILKLTNGDNGKSTYAIVIGKIPPAEENSFTMKLSGKVARNLSAKDYSSIEVVCYVEN